jgi:hypothetical protein
MKRQTGARVEAELWQAYRLVCGREKLRSARPIEEFFRLVVDDDSALKALVAMREAAKLRVDGNEAYARVLLDLYICGKFWFSVGDVDEVSVEARLQIR